MKNKLKKVFITGGAGFIGINLAQYLLDKDGFQITVYDNLSSGSLKNLNESIKESGKSNLVKFIKGDILNFLRLNKAMKGHCAVIHLAAQTSVIESVKNPGRDFMNNVMGTFNVLEATRKNRVDKFIFASSNAILGEQKPPINENILPKPICAYGANKLYGEALCLAYYRSYDLKTVSLRFANTYGPYSDYKESVVARFLRRAIRGLPLEIYGDGLQTRDFIHAQDICQAIHLSLTPYHTTPKTWGEVFQIATGIETKIIDLAKMITGLVSGNGPRKPKIIFSSKRKGEIRKNYSDIAKAKILLGFNPHISLKDGLKNALVVFKKSSSGRAD